MNFLQKMKKQRLGVQSRHRFPVRAVAVVGMES